MSIQSVHLNQFYIELHVVNKVVENFVSYPMLYFIVDAVILDANG